VDSGKEVSVSVDKDPRLNGLFEDDDNVRKAPAAPKEKKAAPQKKSTGNKILDKLSKEVDLAQMAAGKRKAPSFEDITPASLKKSVKKEDDGKITPPINYVSDTNG